MDLSRDVLIEVALNLDSPQLLPFCNLNRKTQEVCNSRIFWIRKLSRHMPEQNINRNATVQDLRNAYIALHRILNR